MINFPEILPAPKLPKHLSTKVIWLAGEGAGSWFLIETRKDKNYTVTRYSPEGKIECEGLFCLVKGNLDLIKDFKISYPSHCAMVTLLQDELIVTLKRILL